MHANKPGTEYEPDERLLPPAGLLKPSVRLRSRIVRAAAAWLAAMTLIVTSAGAALADMSTTAGQAAERAVSWMHSQQQPDGSFGGFGPGSTTDAVLAIVAAGQDPATFSKGANTPVTFLKSHAQDIAKTAGGAGKLLIAANALGIDGKSFGGVDLVQAIQATYGISATGQYGGDAIGDAFAILGLHAAGQPVPAEAIQRLKSLQTTNGGWSFSGDTTPKSEDTNTTAVVLQALKAEGVDKTDPNVIKMAVTYLAAQQNKDGGWPYQQGGSFGSDSDVNSTAYVVQAMQSLQNLTLVQAGQNFILSLQNKSGAFGFQKSQADDNAGATYQAVPALLGATFIDTRPAAPPTVAPGMPTTGSGSEVPLAALGMTAAIGAIALGVAARRRG
jgi:hypothetical protein